jgi:prephenate dehydrogenase
MDDGFAGFKIGVAGLGLIGGSLAKAFKNAGFYVAGFDTDRDTVGAATSVGAVDTGGCEPSVLFDCDYIFVALYPTGIISFVMANAPYFKKGSVVVDCCGIKGNVCDALYGAAPYPNFTFIGGHPMAGTENNGFSASFGGLFQGASFILTPRADENVNITKNLSELILKAGFGRVVITTPKQHDRMIAFTSQLPHVLACAYVMSPSCPRHDGYSAGSFRDISRVAHINPALWTELFIDNRDELCAEIDTMIENMQSIRDAAKSCDRQTLAGLLQKAREIKDKVDFPPEASGSRGNV